MNKLNYLNIGCGNKFHKSWMNLDMTSESDYVVAANLLNGIPFPDCQFEVIYHSQVLEHIPKEKANFFISECYRVLKTDGIIRIVVPNLENIVDEYKKYLNENLESPNKMSKANYEWIMLEMFDQIVRNKSGGQIAEYLKKTDLSNEDYVLDRMGYVGHRIRDSYLNPNKSTLNENLRRVFSSFALIKKAVKYAFQFILENLFPKSDVRRIGSFRLSGEVHMWMYDRYSLTNLLRDNGFDNITVKNPFDSDIPNWDKYELDVKNGLIYDPTSLFVEARKRNTN